MAQINLYAELLKGGYIKLYVRSKSKHRFLHAIRRLGSIPVISYNRQRKYYESTIYYYKFIEEFALKQGWDFFYSSKLERYYKRFKLRQLRIQKARQDKTFSSKYWTDDPECQLEPYQIQAVNVCYKAKRYLIGDDMGVGKTPESLGVICKAFEDGYERALIVVLNRLKYQWADEIEKFTKFRIAEDEISIVDNSASIPCPIGLVESFNLRNEECRGCDLKKKCKKTRDNPNEKRKYQFEKGRIVIANFEIIDKVKEVIKRQKFDIIIIDEASKMKNRTTGISKALIKIRKAGPSYGIYIPMSGTFIETRLEELWSPFAFTDERILGQYFNFKNNYLLFDYWGAVTGYRKTKQLKKIIDPHIIRRSIEEVWKDRPKLTQMNRTCEMTKLQRDIYEDAKDGILEKLKDLKAQDKINRASILPLINYLIQICDTTETQDESIRESGKLDVLKDMLENEIHPRHKIIIFSFFANKVIPVIERELKPYGKSVVLTGKVKARIFEKRKNKFLKNKDYRFAICSDSMAYGGNMQKANYVINFDLLWNPKKMEQRLRRVYRKGQRKPVTLINLITTNSIEDRMLEVLGEREQLFDEFFGVKTKKRKRIGVNDLLALFGDK